MTATLTKNKTLSLPDEVLETLDLHEGDQFQVDIKGNEIRVKKSDSVKREISEDLKKWIGIGKLPVGNTTDEYLDFIRDR